jgi:hypothetical protein
MGLPRRRHRLVRQPDLLHRRHEADRRHTDPAPLLGDQDPEKTQLTHLPEEIGRTSGLLPRQRGT